MTPADSFDMWVGSPCYGEEALPTSPAQCCADIVPADIGTRVANQNVMAVCPTVNQNIGIDGFGQNDGALLALEAQPIRLAALAEELLSTPPQAPTMEEAEQQLTTQDILDHQASLDCGPAWAWLNEIAPPPDPGGCQTVLFVDHTLNSRCEELDFSSNMVRREKVPISGGSVASVFPPSSPRRESSSHGRAKLPFPRIPDTKPSAPLQSETADADATLPYEPYSPFPYRRAPLHQQTKGSNAGDLVDTEETLPYEPYGGAVWKRVGETGRLSRVVQVTPPKEPRIKGCNGRSCGPSSTVPCAQHDTPEAHLRSKSAGIKAPASCKSQLEDRDAPQWLVPVKRRKVEDVMVAAHLEPKRETGSLLLRSITERYNSRLSKRSKSWSRESLSTNARQLTLNEAFVCRKASVHEITVLDDDECCT